MRFHSLITAPVHGKRCNLLPVLLLVCKFYMLIALKICLPSQRASQPDELSSSVVMKPITLLALCASSLLAVVSGQKPAPSPRASLTKVNLNPSNVRYLEDPEYSVWTLPAGEAWASAIFNGVNFTLATGDDGGFEGTYYKIAYTRFVSSLGERVIDEGVTTDDQLALPMTLTLTGLSPGTHTLLAWHNCWDNLKTVSPLNITVDGTTVATVRHDPIPSFLDVVH